MGITNLPNGVSSFGVPLMPKASQDVVCGNVFWVDSGGTGDDSPSSGDFANPFKTLDYAVGKCTANNGDVIYIKAGHAETISTATALAIDVAGISIVGVGSGADRPTFTVGTAATATITISAASVKVENIIVKSALDGLNTAITVTGANCTLDIEHQDTSSTVEADIAIACSGDGFVCRLRDIGFAGGDQRDQSITLNGVDNARIDIDFYGKVATAVVNFITASCTDVEVRGTMYVSGTTNGSKNVVDTVGSSTWYMDIADSAAGANYTGGSAAAVASDDVSAITAAIGTLTNTGGTATIGGILGDVSNVSMATNLAKIGTITNTGGTATIGGVLGDVANVTVATSLAKLGTITNTGGTATIGGLFGDLANVSMRQRTSRGIVKSVASIATANLFTIAGGMVKVVNIVGYITTAIQAQANNVKLVMTPTGGTATDLCAVLDVNAAGQYGLFTITGTFANALALTATAGVKAGVQAAPFITSPGILSMNCSATNTGAIDWYIEYVPMDEDATITAA